MEVLVLKKILKTLHEGWEGGMGRLCRKLFRKGGVFGKKIFHFSGQPDSWSQAVIRNKRRSCVSTVVCWGVHLKPILSYAFRMSRIEKGDIINRLLSI